MFLISFPPIRIRFDAEIGYFLLLASIIAMYASFWWTNLKLALSGKRLTSRQKVNFFVLIASTFYLFYVIWEVTQAWGLF